MPYLLDVNVLIALIDANHVHHARAMRWFIAHAIVNWLTCPTTQNGVIRIMSGSRYGAATFTPAAVAELLESLMRETDHRFVPDDISLLDDSLVMSSHLLASNQVTDTYLLAVAVKNGAMLATLDQRLATQAVHNGSEQLHLI